MEDGLRQRAVARPTSRLIGVREEENLKEMQSNGRNIWDMGKSRVPFLSSMQNNLLNHGFIHYNKVKTTFSLEQLYFCNGYNG